MLSTRTFVFVLLLGLAFNLSAQTDTTLTDNLGGDGYRDGQFPGLGRAASEIFYSDKKLTFSGYAEIANVLNGGADRDISSGDLELYYSNLYRVVPFIGVRISRRIFWNTELGIEYMEGNGESEAHFFPELYFDFIYKPGLNFRVGIQPLNIGYINNNEEPVLFLSVNRPETERIILPSQWIETGILFYGEFNNKFNYAFGITNGAVASKFKSPTWIREGAETQFESWNKPAFHGQVNYLPLDNITLSLSAYYNASGRDEVIENESGSFKVKAPLQVYSAYARYDKSFFSIIGTAVWGSLGETEQIFQLTSTEDIPGQIIGSEVYGFYIEPAIDIIELFGLNPGSSKLFYSEDAEIPVFVRYERLDTHAEVFEGADDFIRNNLNIWMLGANYKPNHNLALKFNVRFRENYSAAIDVPSNETLYELGLGIEF